MAYDWKEYLVLAQNLAGNNQPPTDEAKLRTAISRAYYSLFNLATQIAEEKWGFAPVFDDHSHESLVRHLLRRPENIANRLGKELKRMKKMRVLADYRDEVPNLNGNASDMVTTAAMMFRYVLG